MKYGGPHSDAATKSIVFGRELLAPLTFRILPSANIVNVHISQHFVPISSSRPPYKHSSSRLNNSHHNETVIYEESKLDAVSRSSSGRDLSRSESIGGDSGSLMSKRASNDNRKLEGSPSCGVRHPETEIFQFSSECILRVTIANHDTQVLCVWVGDITEDETFNSLQWTPPSAPASHSVVPGQAVQVSCTIPTMSDDQMPSDVFDIELVACQWIHSSLCGYWQSVAPQPTFTERDETPTRESTFDLNPNYGTQGTIPIRTEHIMRTLNPTLLSTFVHAFVTLSVRLSEPYSKSFIDLREMLSPSIDLGTLLEPPLPEDPDWTPVTDHETPLSTQSRSDLPSDPKGPNGEVWGIQMDVGEFLNCEAIVENATNEELSNLIVSICTERMDESADGDDILFRKENGHNDAGMLIVGRVSNIPVTVVSGSQFKHR